MRTQQIVVPSGRYKRYCTGATIGGSDSDYTAVVGIACEEVPRRLTPKLDEINAYDKMERTLMIGQVNMIIVSSFCRAKNAIWGLDIDHVPELRELFRIDGVPVYNGMPLNAAGRELFRRYPIAPGEPVFFAAKDGYGSEGQTIYAALGIGIPMEEDFRNARLFMEDVGVLNAENPETDMEKKIEKMAQSIIQIGRNQNVQYERIIVLARRMTVSESSVGGAMQAVAYVRLAQNAITSDIVNGSLFDWIGAQDRKIFIDPRIPHPDEPYTRWKGPSALELLVH